jgi:histidine triad (HIT) family protein
MAECAFCEIIVGRAPASLVASSDHSLAFSDLRQPLDIDRGGHVLVVPRLHIESLDRLDDDSAADLMGLAVRVAGAMRAEFGDSYSLWQSNGEAAFQEVPHVHLHLITRVRDDGLLRIYPEPPGAPDDADREQLERLAERLRGRLGDR